MIQNLSDIIKFDPDVKKIEDEIIDKFMKSSTSTARGEYTSKIMNYFLTRKYLTQRKLQELTGISAGKISQEINDLLKMGLINMDNRSSKGEITYVMDSIQSENFTRGNYLIKTALQWEDKFLMIKEELESEKENLKHLNGYNKITKVIDQNLMLMMGYKRFLRLWENLQQKYNKE